MLLPARVLDHTPLRFRSSPCNNCALQIPAERHRVRVSSCWPAEYHTLTCRISASSTNRPSLSYHLQEELLQDQQLHHRAPPPMELRVKIISNRRHVEKKVFPISDHRDHNYTVGKSLSSKSKMYCCGVPSLAEKPTSSRFS